MKPFIILLLATLVAFRHPFTECINLKGYLKSSNKTLIPEFQTIVAFQGKTLLGSSRTKKGGAFSLNFCTGDGTGNAVDFFAILQNRDTLLLASVEAFQNDGNNTGNLYLPKKGAPKETTCPKCHRSDQLYTLVYVVNEQRDFETSSSKFYCKRDKTKFSSPAGLSLYEPKPKVSSRGPVGINTVPIISVTH